VSVLAVLALWAATGCSSAEPGGRTGAASSPASAAAPPPAATPARNAPCSDPPAAAPPAAGADVQARLTRLEEQFDARLGVYAVDTGSGSSVEHRADERFAHASTIKALAAAAVLRQASAADLDQVVRYARSDLVSGSPVTERRVGDGMTLRELGGAAVRHSDNTAANLLLRRLGGPDGLERALREVGDEVTQVDRVEPALNQAVPGDPRDTSTPRALGCALGAYVLGPALDDGDRAVLTGWLTANTTGDALVRAGVPGGWEVGDRTGAARYGTRNDIAVLWPPGRAPVVLAVLSRRDAEDAEHDDELVARATEVVVAALSP